MTFPTMGGGKDSYLGWRLDRTVIWIPIYFPKCGQIAIATTCILFGKMVSKFQAFRFSWTQSLRPGRSAGGFFMALHAGRGHLGSDRLILAAKTRYQFPLTVKLQKGCV